jgi:hypothetical protein
MDGGQQPVGPCEAEHSGCQVQGSLALGRRHATAQQSTQPRPYMCRPTPRPLHCCLSAVLQPSLQLHTDITKVGLRTVRACCTCRCYLKRYFRLTSGGGMTRTSSKTCSASSCTVAGSSSGDAAAAGAPAFCFPLPLGSTEALGPSGSMRQEATAGRVATTASAADSRVEALSGHASSVPSSRSAKALCLPVLCPSEACTYAHAASQPMVRHSGGSLSR